MSIPEVIQRSLEYIEQNLKTELTAEELARRANYSTFHFYRLFSSAMGVSVSGYVLQRRLDHALGEIAAGRKAIDVVLEYGFDTYAGFYKAFARMYGCSPRKYLSIYQHHKPQKPEVVTMYTEKELRTILENWNIDRGLPIGHIPVMEGTQVSASIWSVGGDYFLKTGSRERLRKNLTVAKALHRQGFAAAMPVLTKAGEDYLEGEALFVLTHIIPGNPLPRSDRLGGNCADAGRKYGQSIARLHKALREVQQEFLPDEVNLYQNITQWALPNVRRQNVQWSMGLEEAFFQDFTDTFAGLYDELPKQLIHRDPNPSNILFDHGEVSGFIDFDLCEVNIRLWDACYCATGILAGSGEGDYEKWPDVLADILRGYDEENALAAEEKQAVFYVLCAIEMICAAYFESREEYKQLAKSTRGALLFIVHHKEQIQGIFEEGPACHC